MRDSYPAFQARTKEGLEELWSNCLFAFDASSLLDLYRVTPASRKEFLSVLEQLKERLWLPHQAGLEYYTNRLKVISTGEASYGDIPKMAGTIAAEFRKSLDVYRQYRWIEADRWAGILEKSIEEITTTLEKEEHILTDFKTKDPIEEQLNELFAGRVGRPFTEMHEIYDRAERRLQLSVPPGFKDLADKKDFHRYGDVILWLQLLDFGKSQQKPLVLITSDSKADWWLRESGKTLGPRPELIQEMFAAGVTFHMYSPARFIEHEQKSLKPPRKSPELDKAIEELRAVEEEKIAETTRPSLAFANPLLDIEEALRQGHLVRSGIEDSFRQIAQTIADVQRIPALAIEEVHRQGLQVGTGIEETIRQLTNKPALAMEEVMRSGYQIRAGIEEQLRKTMEGAAILQQVLRPSLVEQALQQELQIQRLTRQTLPRTPDLTFPNPVGAVIRPETTSKAEEASGKTEPVKDNSQTKPTKDPPAKE